MPSLVQLIAPKCFGDVLSHGGDRRPVVPSRLTRGVLPREEPSALSAPACDAGILWDDPALDLAWPMPAGSRPELSAKDRQLPLLADFTSPFAYDGHPLAPLD